MGLTIFDTSLLRDKHVTKTFSKGIGNSVYCISEHLKVIFHDDTEGRIDQNFKLCTRTM